MFEAVPYIAMAFAGFWAFERFVDFVIGMFEHAREVEER